MYLYICMGMPRKLLEEYTKKLSKLVQEVWETLFSNVLYTLPVQF